MYETVDDLRLITSAEAAQLGMSNAELVQQARMGKLDRIARGVYRMPIRPFQEAMPYTTDPTKIQATTPGKVRRNLGNNATLPWLLVGLPYKYLVLTKYLLMFSANTI